MAQTHQRSQGRRGFDRVEEGLQREWALQDNVGVQVRDQAGCHLLVHPERVPLLAIVALGAGLVTPAPLGFVAMSRVARTPAPGAVGEHLRARTREELLGRSRWWRVPHLVSVYDADAW